MSQTENLRDTEINPEILDRVLRVVCEDLNIHPEQQDNVSLNSPLGVGPTDAHLGLDNQLFLKLIMALEEDFKIDFPDTKYPPVETGELYDIALVIQQILEAD